MMLLTAEEKAVVVTNCDWLCAVERKMMLTPSNPIVVMRHRWLSIPEPTQEVE